MLRTSALRKVQNLQKSALPYVEVSIKYSHLTGIFQGTVQFFLLETHNPHRTAALLQLFTIDGQALAFYRCDILRKTPSTLFFPWWHENFPAEMTAVECFSMSFTACADFHGPPAVRHVFAPCSPC